MLTHRVLPSQRAAVNKQLKSMRDRIAAETDGSLELGQKGTAVVALQKHLQAAGLFNGKSDGRFGTSTQAALKKLEQQAGLTVDGKLDSQTFAAIRDIDLFVKKGFTPKATLNQRGADIKQVEGLLSKLKLKPGKADGIFDQRTAAAVRSFQRKHKLAATGDINARTAKSISSAYQASKGRRVTGYVNGSARKITVRSVGNGEYLRTDAASAFLKMKAAAGHAGINLSAGSGFRTMAEQRVLYQRYLDGTGNLAARPGYSNHQGGIAMDVDGVGGYGTHAYRWLSNNARRFGFVNDVGGEYWHWTYKR